MGDYGASASVFSRVSQRPRPVAGLASMPLAARAGRLIGVDSSPDMLSAFREQARQRRAEVDTVLGRWPDAAALFAAAEESAFCHG